jgi:hypothetical protein
MDSLVEWRITDTSWLQVTSGADGAGCAFVNLAVDDLAAARKGTRAGCRAEPEQRRTTVHSHRSRRKHHHAYRQLPSQVLSGNGVANLRGKEGQLPALHAQLQAIEQPNSGLLRSITLQDQNDPSRAFQFVLFESEEKARAREQDPRRQQGLEAVRTTMAEIFNGPPEFTNLTVGADATP